ncbi:5,10-methylenetetrahydrofolate reductase [Synechococcus sp. PCC 7502]|uniref:methylenetetrahydrofolate reductase n=1 Tax=Synechococcus sp. PCC 7502 TaxID=1173263 RepID=UPI00029FAED3|nr:methylenetetrahydrofolate reductase [Synechococcus sp. PCC 7502]AFY74844.1 5,10-methylenetetrahydrofolate reductase [Synechococcus sp. PCC 7502]
MSFAAGFYPNFSNLSNLYNSFKANALNKNFLITAEVAPPRGCDPQPMISQAQLLKGRVHAVNITDSSRAVLAMSPLAASVILQYQVGITTIYQLACRDRNVIALQGDLLGASALGLQNVLALTGDPVKAGDHPQARAVFDLESVRLLQAIAKLNQGQDINGRPLDQPTDLFAGAAVDPQSSSWSGLQRRFERKLAAGAEFFQSQLITDFDLLDKFMQKLGNPSQKPILAGVFLLKSAKNAQFINKYVPGVHIPDHIINRLAQAPIPLQEGIAIAAEQVKAAREICQGVHLMAVKTEHLIPQILDLAGIPPLV